jgi:hypothetical protein
MEPMAGFLGNLFSGPNALEGVYTLWKDGRASTSTLRKWIHLYLPNSSPEIKSKLDKLHHLVQSLDAQQRVEFPHRKLLISFFSSVM